MICDWFIKNMPWLVEHVGGMPCVWQVVLAFGIIAALCLGYHGLQSLLVYTPRKRRTTRINWVERWNRESELDYDWVDPEKVEAWSEDC